MEDPGVRGGEHGAVCRAGGASTEWVEGEGILGGRPWEAESFPAVGGRAQQEATGAQADGKSSGVSHLLSYSRHTLGTGIKFSGAPAFDHGGLPSQAGGGSNSGVDGMGGGASSCEGGSRHSAGREGGVGAGMEHLRVSGNGASTRGMGLAGASDAAGGAAMEEAEEWGMVLEGGSLWAELEAARQREDWLANKATLGCAGILCWVWEHRVLLDSASAAFVLIQDGLVQMSGGQPPELQQGMARVGRLLAGHWQHNAVALGSW
ncbi:hypothetical protein E4T56_gene431 [Termitomyces sp. T112]|nr:hypothetical protein E4T56_gene431 [Termitomyces sp. T112]